MHITVTARNNNYLSGVEEIEYYAPEELKDSFREFIEKRYQELEEKLKQF
jgi:predicted nucleic acid-binding protein